MNTTLQINDFIKNIPKAELHIHIEGSLEPEMMFGIAKRNNIKIKHKSIEDIKNTYNFTCLQDFLNIYYSGCDVLMVAQDFYDLTLAYLKKARSQNITHCEIFFDPQTHTGRGIKFSTVTEGILKALRNGQKKLGISSRLIMCFLRNLDEESAMKTLKSALNYKKEIIAIGLDSLEIGNPPRKFKRVFEKAREAGFLTVAHAGEEGPADYVKEALDLLKVSRIDHGNNSLDDERLINELAKKQIPLTICPLSNLRLKIVYDLKNHPLKIMMKKGLLVSINSDDPAYFGGYLNENFLAIIQALNLTIDDITRLAKNSFQSSFLDADEKNKMIAKVNEYVKKFKPKISNQ
ncbi:MAG: adenosine deaminase [Parcubacteria group bacterium GW2011_GWA2_38_13b]|nr:MAG: adenosine deaminase [Parcubacteria group bacterium GW2011_GWA2_38_13b]